MIQSTIAPIDLAVAGIRSGQRVFVQGASAYPQQLVDALVRRAADPHLPPLRDVEMVHLHANGSVAYIDPAFSKQFHHRALFVGQNVRDAVAEGRASYMPMFLADIPALFRSGRLPLDVALLHLSPPDEHGYCSLGTSVDVAQAAAESAATLIAQINPHMPRTLGDAFIHISRLDHAVEVDVPLPEHTPRAPTPVDCRIGTYLSELIPDGATLQLGIGSIPDAVLSMLRHHRDLGVHSEVISDGVVDLVERGVITGDRKQVNRGKIVTAFLNGSRRLYDFAHNNPMLEMRPVDYTNDTRVILRQDNMVAINSAIEIDLTGQVCAESIGSRIFSGVGGQMDFLRGAALSRGGKPVIAISSTAAHGTVSRIVPTLQPGAGVTTTRAHVHWVVTEHGIANLHGLTVAERARALIGLAHPDFRAGLERQAHELHLLG